MTTDNSIFCTRANDDANRFSWTNAEISYGEKNKLSPIERHFTGPAYFLEGMTPFSQVTTYVYYSGRGMVVKCRKTLTTYSFDVLRKGERLFFQSDKKDEYVERCEQVFPRL